MASAYPAALDSFATTHANGETIVPATDNDQADALNKIEAELGIAPRGAYATVRERFEANDLKQSCLAASPSGTNVSLTAPGATLDGVTLTNPCRIFLKDQTTPAQNGIYIWTGAALALTRAGDADSAAKLSDTMLVSVEQGAENGDTLWELTSDNPVTLGTTALRFTRVHPAYTSVQASVKPAQGPFNPANCILESFPRHQSGLANVTLAASGIVRVFPLGILRAGQVATALNFFGGTTGSTGLTNSWGGIARVSDRVILAISATSTAGVSSATLKTFTFTSAYTPDSDVALFGFTMFAGTTVPSGYGIAHASANTMANPVINGTADTAQTTPKAVGSALAALTAVTGGVYAYLT